MTTIETSVSPIPVPSSLGWEVSVPFQIDTATGAVAFHSTELDILDQHLESIILTLLGERLMLPTYGSTAQDQVFAPNTGALGAVMIADLKKAITSWEPRVTITSMNIVNDPTHPSGLTIAMQYVVTPFNLASAVSVTVGGAVTSEVTA